MKRVAALTSLALMAFAGNSILCRLALAHGAIDAASFTAIRLFSGAVTLAAIWRIRGGAFQGSWASALALVLYAAPFSFAYLSLGAGMGALILFGTVQLTMVGWGLAKGERPPALVWLGLAVALGGLVALTFPGLHAPEPLGVVLMISAGIAWGAYSLRGRGASDPLAETAGNFLRGVALVLPLGFTFGFTGPHLTPEGAGLAALSGAVTSGLGYALWYGALPSLAPSRAAILQLLVPVIAACGGVVLLSEPVTKRLLVAGSVLIAGVALALVARKRAPR